MNIYNVLGKDYFDHFYHITAPQTKLVCHFLPLHLDCLLFGQDPLGYIHFLESYLNTLSQILKSLVTTQI